MNKIFILLFLGLFMISFISAEFGYDNPDIPRIQAPEPTVITFNNNTGSVNNSEYWLSMNEINTTQMENSGGVLNLLESFLTSLRSLAGWQPDNSTETNNYNTTGNISSDWGFFKSIIIKESLGSQANVEAGNQTGAIEWFNNTFFFTDYKVRRTLVRGQDVITSDTIVENTVTEITIFNQSHGPEYLIAGKQEEIQLWGSIDSVTGVGEQTLNISIQYGGTILGNALIPEANRNDENIEIHILSTVRSSGVTGELVLHGNIEVEGTTIEYINSNVSIDTTSQESLTVSAQWGVASLSNSLHIKQGRGLSIDDNKWT